jgi:hypothetical protein
MSGTIAANYNAPVHSVVSVLATSTSVLPSNQVRKYALIINDSDTTVYLNIAGAAAQLNYGVRLNANGGSYEMAMGNGNICQSAITAISSVAGKALLVTEGW